MTGGATVEIAGYPFECYRLAETSFLDVAAVYVILAIIPGNDDARVIDVGETGELGIRLDGHERRACWYRSAPLGSLWVGVCKMPGYRSGPEDRRALEGSIRRIYRPPCGEQ